MESTLCLRVGPQGPREKDKGKRSRPDRTLDICTCVLGAFAAHRRAQCCMPYEISERWHSVFFATLRSLNSALSLPLRRIGVHLQRSLLESHFYEGARVNAFGVVSADFSLTLWKTRSNHKPRVHFVCVSGPELGVSPCPGGKPAQYIANLNWEKFLLRK